MWSTLVFGAVWCSSGCTTARLSEGLERGWFAALHARAERLDRASGSSVYVWLVDHAPSRLDVARSSPGRAASFDPGALVLSADYDLREACRRAKRDRALLLIFVSEKSADRALALDCGFALERDPATVVVAPR